MKTSDVMKRFPITLSPDDPVWLASHHMLWAKVRNLPVVANDRLIGLVTELDLAVHRARAGGHQGERVERIMRTSPQTCGPDDSLTEISERMAHDKIGCLPVLDKGALVGVVTTTDLLRAQVRSAMEPTQSGGPTVADAMVRNPATCHSDDRLLDAALKMKSLNVRHLPVVDAAGAALGMLSDRDIRTAIGDPTQVAARATAIDRLRVKDAMSAPAITVEPGRSCADVARDFIHLRASAVPVTDERGVVIGILSYIDLLRVLAA